jgi:L-ribulose-5-phosphate 4-epimerase
MLLKELREEVLEANLELVRRGLVLYTFGNASGIDREQGLVVIKPSGVDYDELKPSQLVVTDLNGKIVEGDLRPSSDLDTHTLLYREFPTIGAVVHTHSEFATSFAQAGLPIPPLGTTHADYFYGPVPVTAPLTDEAIGGRYVHETGLAIVERFKAHGDEPAIDPLAVPACLVAGHAPFAWGRTPHDAAHNAVVLEAVAKMAYNTLTLKHEAAEVSQALLDRHYFRKHGANASYGQSTPKS